MIINPGVNVIGSMCVSGNLYIYLFFHDFFKSLGHVFLHFSLYSYIINTD